MTKLELTFSDEWCRKAAEAEEGIEEIGAGSPRLTYERIMAERAAAEPRVEIRASDSEAVTFAGDDLLDIMKYVRAKWQADIQVRLIANGREYGEFSLAAAPPPKDSAAAKA